MKQVHGSEKQSCHTAYSKPLSSPPALMLLPHCLHQPSPSSPTSQCFSTSTSTPASSPPPPGSSSAPNIRSSAPDSTFSLCLSTFLSSFKVHFKFHLHERCPVLSLILLLVYHLYCLPPGLHVWPMNYIRVVLTPYGISVLSLLHRNHRTRRDLKDHLV